MTDRLVFFTTPQEITENPGLPYIYGKKGIVSLYLAQMQQQENYQLSYAQVIDGRDTLSLIYQELARQTLDCMNA